MITFPIFKRNLAQPEGITALTLAILLFASGSVHAAAGFPPKIELDQDDHRPWPAIPKPTNRQSYTADHCAAIGGKVVGDPGDGRVSRPSYRCLNGKKPLGNIRTLAGEPRFIEGAVCCGQ